VGQLLLYYFFVQLHSQLIASLTISQRVNITEHLESDSASNVVMHEMVLLIHVNTLAMCITSAYLLITIEVTTSTPVIYRRLGLPINAAGIGLYSLPTRDPNLYINRQASRLVSYNATNSSFVHVKMNRDNAMMLGVANGKRISEFIQNGNRTFLPLCVSPHGRFAQTLDQWTICPLDGSPHG